MTKPYSYQKWQTARTWPGGGWGEAMAQVRKDQRLSQRDIADYVGVGLATVRKWEDGLALPDRELWSKVEEAMGMPVPDPRVPDHTPAERELIDTMLLMVDELRLLTERLAATPASPQTLPPESTDPELLDVQGAASYLGVSTGAVRNLVGQRSVEHYKIGRRVMFRREDIDRYVDQNKRELPDVTPWQLRNQRGKSPRTRTVKEKPARERAPRSRRPSKAEIAEGRWTIQEFADRWWGVDSAKALLERASVTLSNDASGKETFRYGDVVTWMESNQQAFERRLEDFDPSLK